VTAHAQPQPHQTHHPATRRSRKRRRRNRLSPELLKLKLEQKIGLLERPRSSFNKNRRTSFWSEANSKKKGSCYGRRQTQQRHPKAPSPSSGTTGSVVKIGSLGRSCLPVPQAGAPHPQNDIACGLLRWGLPS
jgi:hypothetical protein